MIPIGIRAQDGNPWHSGTEDVGHGRGVRPDRGGAEEEHDQEQREREEREHEEHQREQHEREEREERGGK
jgi:hypothetical protein